MRREKYIRSIEKTRLFFKSIWQSVPRIESRIKEGSLVFKKLRLKLIF